MLALVLPLLAACGGDSDPVATDTGRGVVPEPAQVGEPRLKRLTATQYARAMADLFDDDLVLPSSLESDERVEGLYAVGSAFTSISSYGVEKYEAAAYSIAAQVMADPDLRERWLPCEPAGSTDDACAEESIALLGLHAWRRPLDQGELDLLVDIAAEAGSTLGDFHAGLEYAWAGLLMSPWFLYRVELGDGERYDDWELASRLSFFLWNTIPDDDLLDAAAAGELSTDAGLAAQVDRMMADGRIYDGVRNLYTEMLQLDLLDDLNKDPTVFTYMSDELGASAREETLRGIEALVLEDDGSYLDLYTSQRTFLDRTLATIYDVPAPAREGFDEAWLDLSQGRRGFFGQVSFLALHAHATSTSATRRGIFVREVVLCQTIPDPPANANTAIPEASQDAPTLRDRIAVHLEDPTCASCHELTDIIGLGFENFDGLGMWRDTENGATIDPSGELDGAAFGDAWDLGRVVADHPHTGPCMTQTMLQYATGQLAEELDEDLLAWHAQGFAGSGHSVLFLMRDVALSPGFRLAGQVQ